MKKIGGFILGVILAIWGSAVANRIGPHAGDVFLRWAAIYIVLHALCLLIYSKTGKEIARKIRAQYYMNIEMSYIAVPAIFAAVGLLFWWGINKTFDEYFPLHATSATSTPEHHTGNQPAPSTGGGTKDQVTAPVVHPKSTPTMPAPSVGVQQQPISPEVQLLERAVEAVASCHSFQQSSSKRLQATQARIQEHDSHSEVTEESKSAFKQWALNGWIREDTDLYNQLYKQEFMEVRKLLAAKVPEAVRAGVDYENPIKVAICSDLKDMTEALVNREYKDMKITFEDGRRYIASMNQVRGK